MNTGRTVFSQLMDYLPTYEFQKCVNRIPAITDHEAYRAEISFLPWPLRN
jgi:hypothetical protein